MSETILRDRYGRVIGKIRVKNDGTEELRDRYGKYLGKYDPRKNETRDRYSRLIGKCNLLPMLLAEDMND